MTLQIGQFAETRRAFSTEDVAAYVALGGAVPRGREVPEPLIGAMFSYLLGVKLPGMGTNYLKQEYEFRAIAQIDVPLVARVEIVRLRPEKHLVDLKTSCVDPGGELLCDGRALVYVQDVAS